MIRSRPPFSPAMRRHEARLQALKLDRLRAYPCVRARARSRALHGEGKLSPEHVLERWREGRLIGIQGPSGALFPWFQVDARRGKIFGAVVDVLRFFQGKEGNILELTPDGHERVLKDVERLQKAPRS